MGSRLEKRSSEVRKRIENHQFDDEYGDEYEGSEFNGFGDYFRRKKIKLQNLDVELRKQSKDNPQIFRGIVAHVNGYTQPSLNDLHKMIVSHGGGFLQYLDGKTMVTHIIASNLTPKKAVEFKAYRIVKPAWVVDSIKAGKLLPWASYRVVDEGPRQKVLGFESGMIVNQQSVHKKGYREQSDASWYADQEKQKSIVSKANSSFSDFEDGIIEGLDIDGLQDSFKPESPSLGNSHDIDLEETEDIEDANLDLNVDDNPDQNVYITLPDMDDSEFPSAQLPIELPPHDGLSEQHPQDLEQPSIKTLLQSKRPISETDPVESPSKRSKLTAEEHNSILLADPNIRKSTVLNPDFMEQYYRESRLHHLSTWRADLKSEMQALANASTSSQKNARRPKLGSRRYIMHVDFDCFFASVSSKMFPEYKDLPTAVAHGSGKGSEIASCNYAAREFGVKNGMWMRRALELCPNIKVLPYDFPEYEKSSREFYDQIIAIGGLVQSVSVDEALVDISNICFEQAGTDGISREESSVEREEQIADEIGHQLREKIRIATGCEVSVGIGGNILLAKLALRKAKPAGLYHLRPDEILDFLEPLEVKSLPGFAYNMGARLEDIGVKYVRDVRVTSKERLISTLGPKTGEKLWQYARGIDNKEVGDVDIRKSVSAEINWGVRFENQDQVDEFIGSLCGELTRRLLKENVKGKHLTLKVMKRAADAPLDPPKHLGHGHCDTFNKSTALGVSTNAKEILTKESLVMLRSLGFSPGELRGIGVQMTKLEPINPEQTESSQKLLQFKPVQQATKQIDIPEDPIEDEITPKKPKEEPVNRILFGADQLNELTPSRKLLNTKGTQFILPSQVDQQVLNELPKNIRSKLVAAQANSSKQMRLTDIGNIPDGLATVPSKSQIDPEIFAALPLEMQSEIISFYDSPINNIPTKTTASKIQSPTSKPLLKKAKGRTPKPKINTLTQSNFITSHFSRSNQEAEAGDSDVPPISPTYLAALPSPLRAEVLAEHNQNLIRARNRRMAAEKKALEKEVAKQRPPRRKLELPSRGNSSRPTFTKDKLCTIEELREALQEWVKEFESDGPYEEDTEALGVYLGKVVKDEGDMSKATEAVKWLSWCVEELDTTTDGQEKAAKERWQTAVDRIGMAVQDVVKEKGLGRLRL